MLWLIAILLTILIGVIASPKFKEGIRKLIEGIPETIGAIAIVLIIILLWQNRLPIYRTYSEIFDAIAQTIIGRIIGYIFLLVFVYGVIIKPLTDIFKRNFKKK